MRRRRAIAGAVVAAVMALAPLGCSPSPPPPADVAAASPSAAARPGPGRQQEARRPRVRAVAPPAWLGTRVLPRAANGYGRIRPTPKILRNRRFTTVDRLPPPASGRFAADVRPVPAPVARRSTWAPGCPVALEDLRYVTVSFWGFDGRAHTGELLINAAVARDIVGVFKRLHRERFPIEEMRVVSPPELDAPPTGDGNNTTAFVCRAARGTTSWSQHAYGLAVDVNPFANPYVKDEVVLPELASAYTDRGWRRSGMHHDGSAAVRAFDAIGWQWGGTWSGLKDWMHFSANGR